MADVLIVKCQYEIGEMLEMHKDKIKSTIIPSNFKQHVTTKVPKNVNFFFNIQLFLKSKVNHTKQLQYFHTHV